MRALLAGDVQARYRMECAECEDDAASEQFAKLVRKLSVCEEEDRTERRAFVSRHAAQAGTTVAATLAQLQEDASKFDADVKQFDAAAMREEETRKGRAERS